MELDGASAKQFVDELRDANRAFYSSDRGQGALRDLQQTFPHPWLYVGELLQNAVDARAKKIRLAIVPGSSSLIVEHDGKPFTKRNVEELSARGISTKGAGTVGFMGIGFKAVFQSFECVDVSSGPWRFRFCVKEEIGEYGDRQRDWLGCVLPEYVPAIDEPSAGMQCRFVLHGRLDKLGPVQDDVTNVLSADLLVLALLARRGVTELDWNERRWLLSYGSTPIDDRTNRALLEALDEATGTVRQWVLFSASYQPSREAIARFLEHRQIRPQPQERAHVYAEAGRERSVDVFCPLDDAGFPVPPAHGQAYALLATGVTIPIGLHVQADWLLNTSRRELMEVATNAWHQEILGRLASLLRAYLHWITGIPSMPDTRLAAAYAVLPVWTATEGTLGTYVQNPDFRTNLRTALSDLAFLPVRREDGIRFATPTEARLLPPALRVFDERRLLPWALFGGESISTAVLGGPALQSLDTLQLLRPLAPHELLHLWENGAIGAWRDALGTDATKVHLKLLQALSSLDDNPGWRDAPLRCLPTASGSWIDRHHAIGLPANWDAIPEQDPPVRTWIEPHIPKPDERLDWSFDRAIQRDTVAEQYITNLQRQKLDQVLGAWWRALPPNPDEDTCTQILETTCWVLAKQRQQASLITHILGDDTNGQTVLVRLSDAVLADPYANRSRRYFFPNRHAVSGRYLPYKPGFSDANWRSFFEDASKALNGPLRLVESTQELSRGQLKGALPEYTVPDTKSSRITARWRDQRFSSDNYLLIDAVLPGELRAIFTGTVQRPAATAAAQWLTEARQELPSKAVKRVAYVPYYQSATNEARTGTPASWVAMLQESSWVYALDGTGSYPPSQLLARVDPARPQALVAEIPDDLIKTLESCGIVFGSSVPEVASIERLRREGPLADTERVVELLDQAIADATTYEHREELRLVLANVALIVVTPDVPLIDRAPRICMDRVVQRGARGGGLGGWLVPLDTVTDALGAQDAHVRLLRAAVSVSDVPVAPTGEQALAFLRWVWQYRPDAELVRRTLPRAYRLMSEEQATTPDWEDARPHAMVYVASRKWVSVTNDDLFLDDLADERLKGMVSGLVFATPGHLGETPEEQYAVAALLGIRRLSDRVTITAQVQGAQAVPATWAAPLRSIIALMESYVEDDQEYDPVIMPPVVHCTRITKSLIDDGTATRVWDVHATRDGERIVVAGAPDDFAANFCQVLLQCAGLARRQDLDALAPTLTQLIGWMDRPDKFNARLAAILAQRGDTTASAPPAAPKPTDPGAPTPEAPREPAPAPEPTPAPEPSPTGEPSAPDEPDSMPPKDNTGEEPPMSGGYTAEQREGRLKALLKQRKQIDNQIAAGLGVSPLPDEIPEPEDDEPGTFASDIQYRAAVVAYERLAGRYAETKDAKQPGYDIDSFDRPLDNPEKLLVRRIEVKGHGCPWDGSLTVALSDRQFIDAYTRRVDGTQTGEDFDYWLYVVERQQSGLHVLPIRNPSRRAAKFEFRGGTWRNQAQVPREEDGSTLENETD